MIVLYLKKVFSTRACWWYPDSFFHRRRPISLTRMIVRSRDYSGEASVSVISSLL